MFDVTENTATFVGTRTQSVPGSEGMGYIGIWEKQGFTGMKEKTGMGTS